MPFDAMELFKAGSQLGEAQAGPASYATQNVMDMFRKQMEMQMQLALQAGLFTGEKSWEMKNMPTQVAAQKDLEARARASGGVPSSGVGQPSGNVNPTPVTGFPPTAAFGGNRPIDSDNQMITTKRAGFGGEEQVSPGAEGQLAAAKERATAYAKINPMVGSAVNIMKTHMSAFKQMTNENPMSSGRVAGFWNMASGTLGTGGTVNPYEGLVNETAGEIAKIALFGTGARVGPEITNMYKKIVSPKGIFSTLEEIRNGTRFALHNAFGRQASYQGIPYKPEDYEPIIQDVLDSPAFKSENSSQKDITPERYPEGYKTKSGFVKHNGKWYQG